MIALERLESNQCSRRLCLEILVGELAPVYNPVNENPNAHLSDRALHLTGGAISTSPVEVEQNMFPVDADVGQLLHAETHNAQRVLEIGCGVAQYRTAVGPSYLGLDVNLADYRPGIPRNPDVVGSAVSLPFGSECFDVVFMHCVLHLLPDQLTCACEAARILTRGGRLILIDWSRRSWAGLLAVGHAHSWMPAAPYLRDVCSLLESAGLETCRLELTSRPGLPLLDSTPVGKRLLRVAIDHWARSRVTIIARKR
jgi:SAM-dependent methyltransferase